MIQFILFAMKYVYTAEMNKKTKPTLKSQLHPRNKHCDRYDFSMLIKSCPELDQFVRANAYGDDSIDFFNPKAVLMLNKALLKHYYKIDNWNIPENYLCPPIPGRADYIHHIADLLATKSNGVIPKGNKINCLDIGVGANCIYPIIGNYEFGWSFIASDIDSAALKSAQHILATNPPLNSVIELRQQHDPSHIFQDILQTSELIDLSICNPPFHASAAAARLGTQRKLTNLTGVKNSQVTLNFGGQHNELWCHGGEQKFIETMIIESQQFARSCFWFSTLISKKATLDSVYKQLEQAGAFEVKTLPMQQGNKTSRVVAWTFLNQKQQQSWIKKRWN